MRALTVSGCDPACPREVTPGPVPPPCSAGSLPAQGRVSGQGSGLPAACGAEVRGGWCQTESCLRIRCLTQQWPHGAQLRILTAEEKQGWSAGPSDAHVLLRKLNYSPGPGGPPTAGAVQRPVWRRPHAAQTALESTASSRNSEAPPRPRHAPALSGRGQSGTGGLAGVRLPGPGSGPRTLT